jgi:glycolate oxidase iron-sulfur subunit
VHYSRLLDIGREVVEQKVPRSGSDAFMRGTLKNLLPRPMVFGAAMRLGQSVRMLLPGALRAKVPPLSSAGPAPQRSHARQMIALAGCVQPSMYPNVNGATRRVLDRLGIQMVEASGAGCCGAVRLHLNAAEGARDDARRNIDAWWPLLEAGAECLVMTASGCGSHVLEYAHLLQDDPDYAVKAARVVLATRDISEVITAEADALGTLLLGCAQLPENETPLAFHSPCSLQHGLKIRGTVELLLTAAGYRLTPVADSHLCCGSAGTYSVLQPELSKRLQANKLAALNAGAPAVIASANVGCMGHLQGGTGVPVRHWIELIDERLAS